jgi:hypothetical protein
MEKQLQKMLWLLTLWLKQCSQRSAVHLIQLKTAAVCVKGVQAARFAFLAHVGILAAFVLLACGLFIFHIALFYYLPWPVRQRALFMLVCGAIYIFLSAGALLFFSRERFWMRVTGADSLVRRAIKEEPICRSRSNRQK